MKSICLWSAMLGIAFGVANSLFAQTQAWVPKDLVFAEKDGLVAVEAEHFAKQEFNEKRSFHLVTSKSEKFQGQDGDPRHLEGVSGGAYLEVLPDTRRTHGDRLIGGENFSNQPGQLAVISYRVHFSNPGRYYVWVRAYSTGSEDNGLHVGMDGQWPQSGQRLQWCEGKHTWRWESKQRTAEKHCGVPHQIYLDVKQAGIHTIQFSMREDGFEFDRWLMTKTKNFSRPPGTGPPTRIHQGNLPEPFQVDEEDQKFSSSPTQNSQQEPLFGPRPKQKPFSAKVTGELKVWHKVSLEIDGPYAHEKDNEPNPFLDYRLWATFQHTATGKTYRVPGHFAADGQGAETSAESGNQWRVYFAPDLAGQWSYQIMMEKGKDAAIKLEPNLTVKSVFQKSGLFEVLESDKSGRDFRGKGRLAVVDKRYLQHVGSKDFFLKAGADAPETLLAYRGFDNTVARKKNVPLKSYAGHIQDWQMGDPVWKSGQGKGLIGAINYLSGKGCNAFSFLTYNAGGDGDNVWPFLQREDKLHYDCSKLDQWGLVFEHGTSKGMFLHFKLQETEMDDHRQKGNRVFTPTSLDGGYLKRQRKLYCKEMVSRFSHNLGLNWNLGEENTQTHQQQLDMLRYLRAIDPYNHPIVIHTFPDQQDKVYRPFLDKETGFSGLSLQNSHIKQTHRQTVRWVNLSSKFKKNWIVAFDESGSAAHGVCPDLGFQGFDGRDSSGEQIYDEHSVRRMTLWGNLLGGGAGVEYYFGYKFAENDLVCEDWRSRDRSWDYARHALEFFYQNNIPFQSMMPMDELIGNKKHDNSGYCFASPGECYVVYFPFGGEKPLQLQESSGEFELTWYNPRKGGDLISQGPRKIKGGLEVKLICPFEGRQDWVALLRKR